MVIWFSTALFSTKKWPCRNKLQGHCQSSQLATHHVCYEWVWDSEFIWETEQHSEGISFWMDLKWSEEAGSHAPMRLGLCTVWMFASAHRWLKIQSGRTQVWWTAGQQCSAEAGWIHGRVRAGQGVNSLALRGGKKATGRSSTCPLECEQMSMARNFIPHPRLEHSNRIKANGICTPLMCTWVNSYASIVLDEDMFESQVLDKGVNWNSKEELLPLCQGPKSSNNDIWIRKSFLKGKRYSSPIGWMVSSHLKFTLSSLLWVLSSYSNFGSNDTCNSNVC